MRRLLLALMCCLIVGAPAAQTADTQGLTITKTLVAYYSLTGKTEVVAQALAKELGADVRRVEDVEKPSVTLWFIITGAISAMRGVESEIKPIDTDFRGYDRVFVGSPVWAGSPSTPINAFIAKADFTRTEVTVFMTMGGNDASSALKKMSERIEKKGGKDLRLVCFLLQKHDERRAGRKSARDGAASPVGPSGRFRVNWMKRHGRMVRPAATSTGELIVQPNFRLSRNAAVPA